MNWERVKSIVSWGAVLVLGGLFVREMALGSRMEKPRTAGERPPAFALLDLKGERVSLDSFKGRPVLLNFWATWCPPCRAELPDLQELSVEKPGCLAVVGVTLDAKRGELDKFVGDHRLSYPILIDDGSAARAYNVNVLPHSVLVGPDGAVIGRFRGKVTRWGIKRAVAKVAPNVSC